jgi:hypothetical protein
MTALGRVSLTGSFETSLERFKEQSGVTADTGSPTYAMLATERNWTTSVSTVTYSGGTISLTDGAACRLITTCRKYPYVGVFDVPVADGLMGLHIQTTGGGRTFKVDMNGTVYDGWAGQSKLVDGVPNDIARVWITPPSGYVSTGFGQVYSTTAGLVWACGHYSSPFALTYGSPSALNATAGYVCNATAGVSIKSGYVNQYGTSVNTLATADTAFDNGLAPLLKLTISGTIATYFGENNFDPSKIGDAWPGDGTYELWQVNRNLWRWRGVPSVRSDGSTQYDEINLNIADSGGSWAMWVEGRGGVPRFGAEVSPGNLDYNIAAGSLDGTAMSAYSIPITSAQGGYPGEGSATCDLDSG